MPPLSFRFPCLNGSNCVNNGWTRHRLDVDRKKQECGWCRGDRHGGGHGYGTGTLEKEDHIDVAVGVSIGLSAGAFGAHRFWYLSTNCGPGTRPDGAHGEPLVVVKRLRFHNRRFTALLCDEESDFICALERILWSWGLRGPEAVQYFAMTNAKALPLMRAVILNSDEPNPRLAAGINVMDPNCPSPRHLYYEGWIDFHNNEFPNIDVILNINYSHALRSLAVRAVKHSLSDWPADPRRLVRGLMERFRGKSWLVSKPRIGPNSYITIIGRKSSLLSKRLQEQSVRQGFYPPNSPQGQEYLDSTEHKS